MDLLGLTFNLFANSAITIARGTDKEMKNIVPAIAAGNVAPKVKKAAAYNAKVAIAKTIKTNIITNSIIVPINDFNVKYVPNN